MAKKKKLTDAAKQKAIAAAEAIAANHLEAHRKAELLAEAVRAEDIERAEKLHQEHEEAARSAVPAPGWFDWLFR